MTRLRNPLGHRVRKLVLEIGPAIARGDLRAVFQPLVDLSNDRPVGLEALCRFRSQAYGDVPPVSFIPAAIEAGQIFQLTTTMLDLALKQAKPWLADGSIDFVSVNLDASVLARRSIFRRGSLGAGFAPLALPFARSGGDRNLRFCSPDAVEGIRRLRADGVRIALDDFGAGYSSLGELARLPVDIVKLEPKAHRGYRHRPQARGDLRSRAQSGRGRSRSPVSPKGWRRSRSALYSPNTICLPCRVICWQGRWRSPIWRPTSPGPDPQWQRRYRPLSRMRLRVLPMYPARGSPRDAGRGS